MGCVHISYKVLAADGRESTRNEQTFLDRYILLRTTDVKRPKEHTTEQILWFKAPHKNRILINIIPFDRKDTVGRGGTLARRGVLTLASTRSFFQ